MEPVLLATNQPERPSGLRAVSRAVCALAPFVAACGGTSHSDASIDAVEVADAAGTGSDAADLVDSARAGDALDAPATDADLDGAIADGPGDGMALDATADVVPVAALPLHTTSRWIVDAQGHRVKLASVNWYGAEEQDYVVAGLDRADIHTIAHMIRASGFNSVRLPWSNEMYETNPLIADARLAANPSLQGSHALDVFDAVVSALAQEGLLVVLDNHVSRADWCCTETDGNGLWYQNAYPESSWLADWRGIVRRYQQQPAVVAVDLRNELRRVRNTVCTTCNQCSCSNCTYRTPTWGGSDPTLDWHAAAERGGNAVLSVNPNLLVIVEGLSYATDLTGVYSLPVRLNVANRLVYSAHDYSWFHNGVTSDSQLHTDLGNAWGYIVAQGQPYTAPVWVGEFGTCDTSADCVSASSGQGWWFASFGQYLHDADFDWSYWAWNGTQATGTCRTLDAAETYGIVNTSWNAPASSDLLTALQALQPATQGP